MEKPNFWKYLKGKLWIILLVNFLVLVSLSNSLENVNNFSVRLGAYMGVILMNVVWIGIYYFHYKMKVKEHKKLLKEIKKNR